MSNVQQLNKLKNRCKVIHNIEVHSKLIMKKINNRFTNKGVKLKKPKQQFMRIVSKQC
jgi:hypothetical protein